jgi:hypothetical protein
MMGLLRNRIRHRTFLVYHAADQAEASAFAQYFDFSGDVFIFHGTGIHTDVSLLNSTDPVYILHRLRQIYLLDSVVTLVLIGRCTWASRMVDWQIQASLSQQDTAVPNGLLGIVLPSAGDSLTIPRRLQTNMSSGYAHIYPYTYSVGTLAEAVHQAFRARSSSAHLVDNQAPRQELDTPCP